MKLSYLFISSVVALGSFTSCSDVLDVAPDGTLSMEEVYADPDKVGALLNACYNSIPQKGYVYYFFDPLITACSDDGWSSEEVQGTAIQGAYSGNASASGHPIRDMHDGHGSSNNAYWSRYWQQIRLCNQFLENIDNAAVHSETERARFKAEAHVLRAYFYSELIKWFGKLPIVDKTIEFDADFSTLRREKVYDVVKFIASDCEAAISCNELPWRITTDDEAMRATKALAWAIKSKMMLFAASPLFNEGGDHWEEAYQMLIIQLNLVIKKQFGSIVQEAFLCGMLAILVVIWTEHSNVEHVRRKSWLMLLKRWMVNLYWIWLNHIWMKNIYSRIIISIIKCMIPVIRIKIGILV